MLCTVTIEGASTSTAALTTDGASTSTTVDTKRKSVCMLPLNVGTRVLCRWRDNEYHRVKVIERRRKESTSSNDSGEDYDYYVHYTEFNRRLDEWVTLDQLDLDSAEFTGEDIIGTLKRGRKKQKPSDYEEEKEHEEERKAGFSAEEVRKHLEITKVKKIKTIELGKYEIETWYYSPFPPEYNDCSKLYFCEFCLSFMKRKEQLQRHIGKCPLCKTKTPPGNEIYRNGSMSMFEVDGRHEMIYGQNLCYLAKLFLDHKSLQFDVSFFLFYILCERDDLGYHMVGYFSKEKEPEELHNLACILTLPPYQRKGYGKFLITFSYELSKKEKKAGSPEKPLSDLGKVSYKSYWTRVLVGILKEQEEAISIADLSEMTGIMNSDIADTLQELELLRYRKGEHYICADPEMLDKHLKAAGSPGPKFDPDKLIWTSFLLSK